MQVAKYEKSGEIKNYNPFLNINMLLQIYLVFND